MITLRPLSFLCLGLLTLACGNDADSAATVVPSRESTPTAAATLTATTTTTVSVPRAFRDFAQPINQALQARSLEFFSQRARTQRIICTLENTPPGLGGPDCREVGQQFDGFPLGHWRSEGSIVPLESALNLIQRLWTETVPGASDAYGDALPRVYAIGAASPSPGAGQGTRYLAVMTALIQRPVDFAGPGPLRVVLVLSWVQEADDFRLVSLLSAFVLGEEFLQPGAAARVMPVWERF